ncbi:MAG: class I SAM-dependent methyltransferase [Actinocatenispora sp.]
MADATARYDPIAEWYVEFTKDWDAEPQALLPQELRGQRVLDLACGYGTASRWLMQRGALVTGVDLADGLLSRARQLESERPLGVRYLHGNATTTDWWDGVAYDGVLCHMALMDIDDLHGALATAAGVLDPGGWFTFSIFHPCYPGGPESSWSGLSSWPPDGGYAREGWWSTGGQGVRGRAGANHRRLSTYLNAVLGAGMAIEEVAERGSSVPVIFMARCRKL